MNPNAIYSERQIGLAVFCSSMQRNCFSTFLAAQLLLGFALASNAQSKQQEPDAYAPLHLYNGSWELTVNESGKTLRIDNRCKLVGSFYACEQSVDNKVSVLVVFTWSAEKGEYYVQNVMTSGESGGKTVLEINGTRWIYTSGGELDGRPVYYRTTNDFRGRNQIHFEQFQSEDGQHWKMTRSGEEKRLFK